MFDKDLSIDSHIEKIFNLCSMEHCLTVLARSNDCGANAHASHMIDERNRTRISLDTRRREDLIDQFVFSVAEAADGFGSWRIARGAFGQFDPARFQKVAHTVVPWLSIYMKIVFDGFVKRPEWHRVLRCPSLQIFIKHRFPTGRMKTCGVRYYTVHVKQDSVKTVLCNKTRVLHSFFEGSLHAAKSPSISLM